MKDFSDYVKEIYEISNQSREIDTFPIKRKKTEIFLTKPPENEDTFRKSMFLEPTAKYIDAVVLYHTDMKLLHFLDNTDSTASTTYTLSVSKGFTYSMSQNILAGMEFETNFLFAKNKITIQLSLTFSETWNKTTTETISITVNGGEKAYLYQGTVRSAILRYDAEKMSFHYLGQPYEGRYLVGETKTTRELI